MSALNALIFGKKEKNAKTHIKLIHDAVKNEEELDRLVLFLAMPPNEKKNVKDGRELLSSLLEAHYGDGAELGWKDAMKLLHFFGSDKLQAVQMQSLVSAIYQKLSLSSEYLEFVGENIGRAPKEDGECAVEVVRQLLRYVKPCASLAHPCRQAFTDILTHAKVRKQFESKRNLCQRQLDVSDNEVVRFEMAKEHEKERYSARLALELQMREYGQDAPEFSVSEQPGPGELRPEGPRHDNDFREFRSIAVLPTMDELTSEYQPYLPCIGGDDFRGLDEFDAHLDALFRLTREDMVIPLRAALKRLLSADYGLVTQRAQKRPIMRLPAVAPAPGTDLDAADSVSHQSMSVLALPTVSVMDCTPDLRNGLVVTVTYDPSVFFNGEDKKWSDFWEGQGKKYLNRGSLAMLILGNRPDRKCEVYLTLVYQGPFQKGDRIKTQHSVLLQALEGGITARLAELATNRTGLGTSGDWLIQLRNNFVQNTVPVLKALQNMTALDIVDRLGALVPHLKAAHNHVPSYLTAQGISLSFVAAGIATPITVRDYDGLRRELAASATCSLDEEQRDGLALALTQRVALVQGPPGTGKSFVGAHTVAVMIENAKKMRIKLPIVCICYTNHALDAFLLELSHLDQIDVEDIVRVGSRSRRWRLCKTVLCRCFEAKFGVSEEFNTLRSQAEPIEREIKAILKRNRTQPVDWSADERRDFIEFVELFDEDLAARLESFIPHEEREDVGSSTEGAFKKVGKNAKKSQARDFAKQAEESKLLDEYRQSGRDKLNRLIANYSNLVSMIQSVNEENDLEVLRRAKIVGMTTTGAAMYQRLLAKLHPSVLVCEEAGEVLESHVFAALSSGTVEHLVLIGDHKQLRPKANEFELSVDSKKPYKLDRSLLERLADERTLLVTLQTQRRMRPEIAEPLRATELYPKLRDSPAVRNYPHVRGLASDLLMFDHNWPESNDDLSYRNPEEANMVVATVKYLFANGYEGDDLAVLTPYVGQLLLLRKLLAQHVVMVKLGDLDLEMLAATGADDDESDSPQSESKAPPHSVAKKLGASVRISTFDNFQGEEARVVVLSTVRSNKQGRVGFLKFDNRVNVALSRAKHGMIIFGNVSTIEGATRRRETLFAKYVQFLRSSERLLRTLPLQCVRHSTVTRVDNAETLLTFHSDGGCTIPCGGRLPCGHACKKLCHPDDPDHEIGRKQCGEPCVVTMDCGHACKRLCKQECACGVMVGVTLSCGHTAKVACSDQRIGKLPKCNVKVTVNLPCSHTATVSCSKKTSNDELEKLSENCKGTCGKNAPCGKHPCSKPCRGGHGEHSCGTKCERGLLCGHMCGRTCQNHTDEGMCLPCEQKCENKCKHSSCGRTCTSPCALCAEDCAWVGCDHVEACGLKCGVPCQRRPCDKPCALKLICGHPCPSLCGLKCPDSMWCPVCAKSGESKAAEKANEMVDIMNLTTLKDLDIESEWLVMLPCKHAFTVESIDNQLKLDDSYVDMADLLNMLMDPERSVDRRCPTCRRRIDEISRYNRVFKAMEIARSLQLHMKSVHKDVEGLSESIIVLREKVEKDESIVRETWKALLKMYGTVKDMQKKTEERSPVAQLVKHNVHLSTELMPHKTALVSAADLCLRQADAVLAAACAHWKDVERFTLEYQKQLKVAAEKKKKKSLSKDKKSEDSHEVRVSKVEEIAKYHRNVVKPYNDVTKHAREGGLLTRQKAALHTRLLADARAAATLSSCEGGAGEAEKLKQALKREVAALSRDALSDQQRSEVDKAIATIDGGISDEELRMVFKAMQRDIGSGIGSFGGHWYVCPNGHPYTIGECGGAVVGSVCNECGAAIGGTGHRLRSDNRIATELLERTDSSLIDSNLASPYRGFGI